MSKSYNSGDNEKPIKVSDVLKLATDRMAVEKACLRIDNYIAEKWQVPRPDTFDAGVT